MPSLQLWGRRTPVAGDDLRFAATISVLLRLLQLSISIALSILYAQHEQELDVSCIEEEDPDLASRVTEAFPKLVVTYAAASFSLALVGILTDVPLFVLSGRGTPTDPTPRACIAPICYVRLSIFNGISIVATVFGILLLVFLERYCLCLQEEEIDDDAVFKADGDGPIRDARDACPDYGAWLGAILALVVTQCIDTSYALLTWLYFGCCGLFRTSSTTASSTTSSWIHPATKVKAICQCCCGISSLLTCCMLGGGKALLSGAGSSSDLSEFALVFADFLDDGGLLDVTASDIWAALLLVRRVQQAQMVERRTALKRKSLILLAQSQSQDHQQSASMSASVEEEEGADQVNTTAATSPPRIAQSQSLDSSEQQIEEGLEITTESNPLALDSKESSSWDFCKFQGHVATVYSSKALVAREVLARHEAYDQYCIAEGARFMSLAQAIYTWISYLLEHPLTGATQVTCRSMWKCLRGNNFPIEQVEHDNPCCQTHSVAFELIAGTTTYTSDDIVHADFSMGIDEKPYAIVLDHEWQSVVLTIRGTMSLEDVLVDISCVPASMEQVGELCGFDNGANYHCHSGMLKSCIWIYKDLKRHGKLDQVFDKYPTYRLRVIGHSLGAGCAAILSLMLRPNYPDIRCLAFSPPGCIFDKHLAEECSSWMTSYVLDCDLVPRMSLESFEDLRDSILEMICRIRVPKYQVLSYRRKNYECKSSIREHTAEVLYNSNHHHGDNENSDDEVIPDSEFKTQLKQFFEHQAALRSKNKSFMWSYLPLGTLFIWFGPSNVPCTNEANRHHSILNSRTRSGCRLRPIQMEAVHRRRRRRRISMACIRLGGPKRKISKASSCPAT